MYCWRLDQLGIYMNVERTMLDHEQIRSMIGLDSSLEGLDRQQSIQFIARW
jgi:hypothetical protein